MFELNKIAAVSLLSLGVAACGGGGSSSHDSEPNPVQQVVNTAPEVDAGSDITVAERMTVSLDAVATDLESAIDSYQWVQTAGVEIALGDMASTSRLQFEAPEVTEDVMLTFEVTVADDKGLKASDTVSVKITNENVGPTVSIDGEGEAKALRTITLKALAADEDGQIASYNWKQTAGPSISLSDKSSDMIKFTAPKVDQETEFQFEVTVHDNSDDAVSAVHVVVVSPVEAGLYGQVEYERIPYWGVDDKDDHNGAPVFGLDPNNLFLKPVRQHVVSLLDNDGKLVEQAVTDEEGYFFFPEALLHDNASYHVKVMAQLELDGIIGNGFYIDAYKPTEKNSVLRDSTHFYQTDVGLYSEGGVFVDVDITAGWNDATQRFDADKAFAQSFAALDSTLEAAEFFESLGFEFSNELSPLGILWNPEAMYDVALPGVYVGYFNIIDLADPYSPGTVYHEFTHFVESKVLGRTDSPGGIHFPGENINLPLAYSEGLAEAVANTIQGHWKHLTSMNHAYESQYYPEDFYVTAQGLSPSSGVCGIGRTGEEVCHPSVNQINPPTDELTVRYYLLSLLSDRDATERTDNLTAEIGKEGFAAALRKVAASEATSSLYSFASELKALYPEHNAKLEALEEKLGFVADDKWGSTETAFPQFVLHAYDDEVMPVETYLPLFAEIGVSDSVGVCFNGGYIGDNPYRPGTHHYIRFTAPSDGTYDVTIPDAVDSDGETHTYHLRVSYKGQPVSVTISTERHFQFDAEAGQTYILHATSNAYSTESFNVNETVCTTATLTSV